MELVINGTCARAFTWSLVEVKMNYFEMLDWFPSLPSKGKILVKSLERMGCFRKQERSL